MLKTLQICLSVIVSVVRVVLTHTTQIAAFDLLILPVAI